MTRIKGENYELIIFDWDDINPDDDNVDVEVILPSGDRYSATLFTIKNIETLMRRYEQTGECNYGQYLWCSDMVVIRQLTLTEIQELVEHLFQTKDLIRAFSRLEGDDD